GGAMISHVAEDSDLRAAVAGGDQHLGEVCYLEDGDRAVGGHPRCFGRRGDGDTDVTDPELDPSIAIAELERQPQCLIDEACEAVGLRGMNVDLPQSDHGHRVTSRETFAGQRDDASANPAASDQTTPPAR